MDFGCWTPFSPHNLASIEYKITFINQKREDACFANCTWWPFFLPIAPPLTISLPLHRVRACPVPHSGVHTRPASSSNQTPRGEDVDSSFTLWTGIQCPVWQVIPSSPSSLDARLAVTVRVAQCPLPEGLLSGLVLVLQGVSPFSPSTPSLMFYAFPHYRLKTLFIALYTFYLPAIRSFPFSLFPFLSIYYNL